VTYRPEAKSQWAFDDQRGLNGAVIVAAFLAGGLLAIALHPFVSSLLNSTH
jgi:hypothetical protein